MATFTKRGNKWRAQVRLKGVSKSATFTTKAMAVKWAESLESQLNAGEFSGIPQMTFGELLEKYIREVSSKKAGFRSERIRLMRIADTFLGAIYLIDLTKADFEKWQNQRLQQVKEASVLRERTTLSAVINQAIKWEFLKVNHLAKVDKPKASRARERRFTEFEIEQLTHAADFSFEKPPITTTQRTAAAMLFAIETAMRAGEIVGMDWAHINRAKNTVFLPKTKNGHPRTVPLSPFALKILDHLAQVTGETPNVFQVSSATLDAIFRKLKARCGITDLHFHDTRREAATRLAKILTVQQLAKVTGHRDLRILQNTYYAPDMGEIAQQIALSPHSQGSPIASETAQAQNIAAQLAQQGNGSQQPPLSPPSAAEVEMLNALRRFMQAG